MSKFIFLLARKKCFLGNFSKISERIFSNFPPYFVQNSYIRAIYISLAGFLFPNDPFLDHNLLRTHQERIAGMKRERRPASVSYISNFLRHFESCATTS